jgi:protein-disulfide isomerase
MRIEEQLTLLCPINVERGRAMRGESGRTRAARVAVVAMAAPFLVAGACTKDPKSSSPADNSAVVAAADRGKVVGAPDTTALPGVDVSKLASKKQELFFRLVDSLSSPCGKAHSLRTSVLSDTSCRRAPFAARMVASLISDEATDSEIREFYDSRYKVGAAAASFKFEGVPAVGAADSAVKLVEFFDYACPACQSVKPILDEVVTSHGGKFVLYYKQFPLTARHPDSMSAAQAALAAHAQGKFKEMHELLFAKAPLHNRDAVMGYAKEIGLDLARFEADYAAAAVRVETEVKEGDVAGVDSTPSLFINGTLFQGPMHPRYLGMIIEEEDAVNR